ncbi:MAG: hypothetical protein AAGA58_00930 [Verrucomicrobiota bacterium]
MKRPLERPMASATVHARLKPDEVLVTGGYEIGNGRHQFTFIQPEPTTLDDGREAIFVKSRVLELDKEAIESSGLTSLATNARNTLQHAEAWVREDFESTLEQLHSENGVDAVLSPAVVTLPGRSFKIEMGSIDESNPSYAIDGRLVPAGSGRGFDIQTRIERADPIADAAP